MLSRVDIVVLTSNYIQKITELIRSDFYRWRKSWRKSVVVEIVSDNYLYNNYLTINW